MYKCKLLKKWGFSAVQDSSVEAVETIMAPYGRETATVPVIKFKLRTTYVPESSCVSLLHALVPSCHRALPSFTFNIPLSLEISSSYSSYLFSQSFLPHITDRSHLNTLPREQALTYLSSRVWKLYCILIPRGENHWFQKYDAQSVLVKKELLPFSYSTQSINRNTKFWSSRTWRQTTLYLKSFRPKL
jgi:hypothetical protein